MNVLVNVAKYACIQMYVRYKQRYFGTIEVRIKIKKNDLYVFEWIDVSINKCL